MEVTGSVSFSIPQWAVGLVRYSASIVDWKLEELVSMGRSSRKTLAMNGYVYTRSNVSSGWFKQR